jgi:hypothetical protein
LVARFLSLQPLNNPNQERLDLIGKFRRYLFNHLVQQHAIEQHECCGTLLDNALFSHPPTYRVYTSPRVVLKHRDQNTPGELGIFALQPSATYHFLNREPDHQASIPQRNRLYIARIVCIFYANFEGGESSSGADLAKRRLYVLWVELLKEGNATTQTIATGGTEASDYCFADPMDVLRPCHMVPAFFDSQESDSLSIASPSMYYESRCVGTAGV